MKIALATMSFHFLVEAALFREVADAIGRTGIVARLPKDADRSLVGRDDVEDHADGRRLPGAVRSEEPVDGSAWDLEREVLYGEVFVVALDHVLNVDREIAHSESVAGLGTQCHTSLQPAATLHSLRVPAGRVSAAFDR